jgi:hypothetical protein
MAAPGGPDGRCIPGRCGRAPGESVRVLIVGVNKDQARLVLGYTLAILQSGPALGRLIKSSDSESITLTNGVQIVCVANSFRSIRGPTCVTFRHRIHHGVPHGSQPQCHPRDKVTQGLRGVVPHRCHHG